MSILVLWDLSNLFSENALQNGVEIMMIVSEGLQATGSDNIYQ